MYRAEVLSKFPVIQHTYFGSLFGLKPAINTNATKRLEMTPAGTTRTPSGGVPRVIQMPTTFPVASREQNQLL